MIVTSASVASSGEKTSCKLPAADSREGASRPTLDGTIADVRNSCFRVTSRENPAERPRVCVTPQTSIFTLDGGYVAPDQLREGQRVHVWLRDCRPPAIGSPSEAAVIEVASRRPGEDFP
jgi:hypothetical protein